MHVFFLYNTIKTLWFFIEFSHFTSCDAEDVYVFGNSACKKIHFHCKLFMKYIYFNRLFKQYKLSKIKDMFVLYRAYVKSKLRFP